MVTVANDGREKVEGWTLSELAERILGPNGSVVECKFRRKYDAFILLPYIALTCMQNALHTNTRLCPHPTATPTLLLVRKVASRCAEREESRGCRCSLSSLVSREQERAARKI